MDNHSYKNEVNFVSVRVKSLFHMKEWAPRLFEIEAKGNSKMAYNLIVGTIIWKLRKWAHLSQCLNFVTLGNTTPAYSKSV